MNLYRLFAGLMCALFCTALQAAPIAFNFEVRWSAGPLAGTSDVGTLAVDGLDCPSDLCTGIFSPGNAARTLLDFVIDVDGRIFRAMNDGGFPAFPQITFNSIGALSNIDYDGLVSGRALVLLGGVATYFPPAFPAGPDRSFGFVTSIGRVAEPSPFLLIGSALVLAMLLRRRDARV